MRKRVRPRLRHVRRKRRPVRPRLVRFAIGWIAGAMTILVVSLWFPTIVVHLDHLGARERVEVDWETPVFHSARDPDAYRQQLIERRRQRASRDRGEPDESAN